METNPNDRIPGVVQLTNDQLEKLTAPRLLALYNSVIRRGWNWVDDYRSDGEVDEPDARDRYVARIKAVLETKPHVPRIKVFRKVHKAGHKQKLVTKTFTR